MATGCVCLTAESLSTIAGIWDPRWPVDMVMLEGTGLQGEETAGMPGWWEGEGHGGGTVAMASQKCQMCCVIYAVSRMICLQSVYFSCLSAEKYEKDKLTTSPGQQQQHQHQQRQHLASGGCWPNLQSVVGQFPQRNFYSCRRHRLLSFVTFWLVKFAGQVNYWNVSLSPLKATWFVVFGSFGLRSYSDCQDNVCLLNGLSGIHFAIVIWNLWFIMAQIHRCLVIKKNWWKCTLRDKNKV